MDRVADRTVKAAELHIRADLDAEIEADSLGTVLSGAFGQEILADRRSAGKCKTDVRILFCHVKTPLNIIYVPLIVGRKIYEYNGELPSQSSVKSSSSQSASP